MTVLVGLVLAVYLVMGTRPRLASACVASDSVLPSTLGTTTVFWPFPRFTAAKKMAATSAASTNRVRRVYVAGWRWRRGARPYCCGGSTGMRGLATVAAA